MKDNKDLVAILKSSSDIISVISERGDCYTYSNDVFHKLLFIKKEELLEKGHIPFIHSEDIQKAKLLNKSCIDNPGTNFFEKIRFINRQGELIEIEWNIVFNKETRSFLAIGRNLENKITEEGMFDQAKKVAQIGTWVYHVEKNILIWDEEIYNIYELSPSTEMTIDRMKQFFRRESLQKFTDELKKLVENGVPLDEELSFVSGRFRPSTARFMAKSIKSDNTKIYGTVQNLTDVRRIERKAEDYQEAVDKSSIVSITDRYGVITSVNDKFCEISKYTKRELIGQSHKVLDCAFHSDEFWANVWKTIAHGEVWSGEIKNIAKDGSYFWVDTTIIPFKNSMGRIYQYLSIQRDFTENKNLYEELLVSEKLSSIGQISAQILHEVMGPLQNISLTIENLEDELQALDLVPKKAKPIFNNLNEIQNSYDQIQEIFKNMRSILVSTDDGVTNDINIKSTLKMALSLVNAKLRSKDIPVRFDGVSDTASINCTKSDLSQIFLNLINNSADAIEKQKDRWIEISTTATQSNMIITFQDSGPGIPKEICSKIFDTLFTTKGDNNGTGLGMGICRKLIERHDGIITIDLDNKNTTFILSFPLVN